MAVTEVKSTMIGALTPICNDCGCLMCWDITEEEYEEAQGFWDQWTCRDCNPNYKGALTRWMVAQMAEAAHS